MIDATPPMTNMKRKPSSHKYLYWLLWVVACVILWTPPSFSQAVPEYKIKAGYLYRFLSFIDWPDAAFTGPDQPIVICILGSGPFGDFFKPIEGRFVKGRRIAIRNVPRALTRNEIGVCHMLFISASQEDEVESILQMIDGEPVLTVGEVPGFVEQGGMINFVQKENKIRFEINDTAVERVGIQIRSMMKRLAVRIVGGDNVSQ